MGHPRCTRLTPRIVGVNGIRTHGGGNIDRLLLEMRDRGFETIDAPLLKARAWNARWRGEIEGRQVAQMSDDGDIIVAHSYGCLRTWYAHELRDYRAIVCIAPAMDDDAVWRDPERVHCFYSPDDWAVRVGSWLLFHPFGPAGNRGFSQGGVRNHRIDGAGHNDFFVGELVQAIADYVARLALGEDPGFDLRRASPRPA